VDTETRVPINESPYFLHPQSATAATAVHYDRSPRETTEHYLRYDFFVYCFNKYIIIYEKKNVYTRLINTNINNNNNKTITERI